MAPVAELLRGAGLRVSELGGDWALLRAGSLLSRGPHGPADPVGLQEASGPAHSASAPPGPLHTSSAVYFLLGPHFRRGGRKRVADGLWVEPGSVLVFPGVQCRQGALGVEPVGSLTSPPGPTPPASPWADDILKALSPLSTVAFSPFIWVRLLAEPLNNGAFPGGARNKEPACQSRRHMRCGFDP